MIPRIISARPFISLITALVVTVCLFFIQIKESQIKANELKSGNFKERNILPPLTSLPLPISYTKEFSEKWEYRRVLLEGEFLPEHTIYLDNRVSEDAPEQNTKKINGFHIMMPFLINSGEIIWVNRGWIKRNTINRQDIPQISPLSGKQVISGYISVSQKNIFEMPSEKPHIINGHVIALNFYLHDDKKDLPNRNVYPFIITQTEGSADGLIRPKDGFFYKPKYQFDLRTWWFTLLIAIGFWLISGVYPFKNKTK